METKDFKKLFKDLAKKNGFDPAFGGWFKQSEECIFNMQLMRSNFGRYYMVDPKYTSRELLEIIILKTRACSEM